MDAIFHRTSVRKFLDKPVEKKNRKNPSRCHGGTICQESAALGILCRN